MKHTLWSVGERVARSFGYFVREVAPSAPAVEGFAALRRKALEGDDLVALANRNKVEGLMLLGLERCQYEHGGDAPFVLATFAGGRQEILSCPTC